MAEFNRNKIAINTIAICFLLGLPMMFLHKITDIDLKFFVWDFTLQASRNLVPFMAYYVVQNRILKWFFLSYGYVMLSNLLVTFCIYFGHAKYINKWIIVLQTTMVGIITIISLVGAKRYGLY